MGVSKVNSKVIPGQSWLMGNLAITTPERRSSFCTIHLVRNLVSILIGHPIDTWGHLSRTNLLFRVGHHEFGRRFEHSWG